MKSLCKLFVIHHRKAAIDQFVAGIKAIDAVYEAIQQFSEEFELLFTAVGKEAFKASDLLKLCKPVYSPQGSNQRESEEETILWWEEFVSTLDKSDTRNVSAEDILAFITGARTPPPAGFWQAITIEFFSREQGSKRLPFTSTCSLQLNLPRGIQSASDMELITTDALLQCQGFGRI